MTPIGQLERWAYLAAGVLTINNLFIIRFSRAIVYFVVCALLLTIMIYPVLKEKLYIRDAALRPYTWFMLYTIGLVVVSAFAVEGRDGLQFLIPNSIAMLCFAIVPAMATRDHLVPVLRTLFHILPFMCVFFSGGLYLLNLVLIPYSIVVLFWGEFKGAKRWILLAITLMVCVVSYINVDRALLIKMAVALAIGFTSAYMKRLFDKWVAAVSVGLLVIPFLFVLLFLTGRFNVFEFNKYMSNAQHDDSGMYDDTRTGVYEEVITSAIDNHYILFGRSLSRGYDTEFILGRFRDKDYSKQTIERSSEVAALNLFTWGGIVYLLLFFVWQCNVVYVGLKKTNNRYTPILALYVAFYWAFSWVENVQVFSMFYIFPIIIMAMCMSPEFREMDDDEFRNMVQEFF